ncbi:MAG: prepilin peptidase [Myxococcaceae bacterium]
MTGPEALLLPSLFVFGLLVGSFLNVVIARVPQGFSIVRPGSRCPRCGHALSWYENVPLVSWAVLRGRCRSCKAPISMRYPAVEVLSGLLFLASGWAFGPSWELLRALLLVGFLVPLALIDLEHWIVPVGVTVLGTVAGLASALPLGRTVLQDCAIGAATGFVVFWAFERVSLVLVVRIIRPFVRSVRRVLARGDRSEPAAIDADPSAPDPQLPGLEHELPAPGPEASAPAPQPELTEALGAGDKWLVMLAGSFLGWRPLFGLLLLSSIQGALVGTTLLLLQGRAGSAPPPPGSLATEDGWAPEATALPFGPWIALAALELFLLGPWLAASFPSPLVVLVTGMSGVAR